MTSQMDELLLKRQLELEDRAIGLGLDRAMRMISGERTLEDVETFGGEKTDGAQKRKRSLLYLIATEELAALAKAIGEGRKNAGSKSANIFATLEQCGNDEEIAGVVIKAFFDALCIGPDDDEEDDPGDVDEERDENIAYATDVEEDISVVSMATEIAEILCHLHNAQANQRKRKPSKQKQSGAREKTVRSFSPDDMLKPALTLTNIYLRTTKYYSGFHQSHDLNRIEMSDEMIGGLMQDITPDSKNGATASLNQNIHEHLFRKNMVSPKWSPMLVPPKPWTSMVDGGYRGALSSRVTLITKSRKRSGLSRDKCPDVFNALNHLQNTSFGINTHVFSAFSHLFAAYTNVIQRRDIAAVEHASRYRTLLDLPAEITQKTLRGLRKHWSRLFEIHNEAELFLRDRFYFVNYCDFRGRIYPKASGLNYQGSDLPRSLLVFCESKPIADDAAKKWLKIHGANCFAEKIGDIGIDKSTFKDRDSWVNENEAKIFSLGRLAKSGNLFDGLSAELEEWWLKADKPWAFLAWACEWTCYREATDEYLSCLPIEVDGSSNGYQHIAALLRSKNMAHWVNMLPNEAPRDIYTVVTNDADKKIIRHEEPKTGFSRLCDQYFSINRKSKKSNSEKKELVEIKRRILAVSLKSTLPRSAAKKVIMTYPYSAKLFRMAKILDKVKGIYEEWTDDDIEPGYSDRLRKGLINETCVPKIKYIIAETLASTICESITDRFPETTRILEWFKQIGGTASKVAKSIHWVSPSGFPVQQHYELPKSERISVLGRKFTIKKNTGETNIQKNVNALGPNFIHSCDAAHLVKTVNRAWQNGITSFRMIHDSYATHAADMEKLFKIIREAFIEMYQGTQILENFRAVIEKQADKLVEIDPAPLVGDLDINQVRDAEYFFA